MSLYTRNQRWKFILFLSAVVFSIVAYFVLRNLTEEVRTEERKKIIMWAEALERKSELVEYTDKLFKKLQRDERKKAELWSDAMNLLLSSDNSTDLTILVKIISSNENIPIILTDKNSRVLSFVNLEQELSRGDVLSPALIQEYSEKHVPIEIRYGSETLSYLYYKDSKLFAELQDVMNNLIESFMTEVVQNSASVPVIITDSTMKNVISTGNLDSVIIMNDSLLNLKLEEMASSNLPIETNFLGERNYIYYEDSFLLQSLKYYPVVLFAAVILFILVSYMAFTSSRKFEQNQVWVGMSKETAHQLGTPISSLMAWVELLKMENLDESVTNEIEKDVNRLNTIADRFQKIGSAPKKEYADLNAVLRGSVDYMKKRTSDKVKIEFEANSKNVEVPLSATLFEWVIENLMKNAVDAISGNGRINISVEEWAKSVAIDIADTGKGIPRSKHATVFKPGFTTKQRGWGLGLSLAKRIIESYHKGKIFVKNSEVGEGTTFRIILPKK